MEKKLIRPELAPCGFLVERIQLINASPIWNALLRKGIDRGFAEHHLSIYLRAYTLCAQNVRIKSTQFPATVIYCAPVIHRSIHPERTPWAAHQIVTYTQSHHSFFRPLDLSLFFFFLFSFFFCGYICEPERILTSFSDIINFTFCAKCI